MNHDSSPGDAILSLQNLQNLVILCKLCTQSHGHEYLFKLNSPALRQFTLRCYGSTAFGKDTDSRSVLLAPFMPQLTALSLECEQTKKRSSWNGVLNEQLLQEADVSFHLDTLVHNGSPFFDFLLSHCPVQRLRFTETEVTEAAAAIRRSPGTLTHLFAPDLISWLLPAMEHDIEPYINLRFIGPLGGLYGDVGSF